MKGLFYAVLITFCIAINPPSYGVYLEYEDSGDRRVIRVDFRNLEDVYSRDSDVHKEGGRRISKMLAKEALSFTDKMTVQTSQRGMFTFTLREKDFFTSPRAHTFIEWIESCAELGKLEFLGVDEEHQVSSVRQAFAQLINQHTSTLEEDFILMEECIVEGEKGLPLERINSSLSFKSDLPSKFKKVLIRCTGKQAEAIKKEIHTLLHIHHSLMKNFVIEE